MLTVDAPVNGIRSMEQRAGFRLPDGISAANLAGMEPDDFVPTLPGSPGSASCRWSPKGPPDARPS
ncbi:hypothetical protein [Arenibaculum pallidiluteum]|uniref:hypothetical protein n=1 Tax=Arenibaculum pallidiluteum TaxID=2812559 RepID=UPI002E2D6FC7|nr:hypothetical protein [Arenibaculum pallidiluteum]